MPGLVHLMVYWQNKLFWDPDADRAEVLGEYYRLFFGPAEAEMRAFYELAEEVWSRPASRNLTESTGFLQEADVDRYFELLAKARAKAGKGHGLRLIASPASKAKCSRSEALPEPQAHEPSIRISGARRRRRSTRD